MRHKTAILTIVGALAAGSATTPAAGQDAPAEIVLLNGDHRVPVVAFGPSMELQVGQFVPPSAAGDFFFIAEREAFFHPDIDKMGGQPSTSVAVGSAANVASAAAVASDAAGAAGEAPPPPPPPAVPQWRSVGAHAFDLLHDGVTYDCMAGQISENGAGQMSSLGDGAADLEDPRLYRVQCMGWTASD